MKVRSTTDMWNKWVLLLGIVAYSAAGCVSQRYVDDLETVYRRSQEQIIDLRAQLEEKQTEIDVLRTTLNNQDPQLLARLEKALSSHDQLATALAKAENRLRALSTGPVLDAELDHALIELAQSNPNLITYDPEMGMVKFQSDLTFALGSTEVSAQAVTSLKKLAGILKSDTGRQYTVRIVGHTDNVPIGRPATRAKHPTNWHLSVHRAIAVKDAIAQAGVEPTRIGVAGYGEHRPIAPNGPKGNKANRRVEIYLLRYTPAAGNTQASGTSAGPNAQGAVVQPAADTPVSPKSIPDPSNTKDEAADMFK